MNAFGRRVVASAVVLLALLLTPANIFSCGPFFSELVFVLRDSPDPPLHLFAQGRLGILQPTYDRKFLVVAYRYLSGVPLTKAEEGAVAQAWAPKVIPQGQPSPDEVPVMKWAEARSAALGQPNATKMEINRYKEIPNSPWVQYPNCGDDAFVTAAETAAGLSKKFGAGSAPVRDWVQAQDTVFRNCGETAGVNVNPNASHELHPHIPQAGGMENAVLKLDRQYQIAAANFYAGDFRAAAQQFQQIADERDSPWRIWAPYLVARCYIREATLNNPSNAGGGAAIFGADVTRFDVQKMTSAEKQLQSILKDLTLASVHPAAQRLLQFVEGRLHPDQRLHEVAQQLAGREPASDIAQGLTDFSWLIRQRVNAGDFPKWREDLAKRGLLDDITDWVLTFQQPGPEELSHSVQRWRTTKSQAWLIAGLSMAKAGDNDASALADAANAIAPNSPAYEMAVYYRAQLLIGQDKVAEARRLLDANLPAFGKGPLSAYNLLLAQRFALATDFREFLEFAPRTPIEYAFMDCDDCNEPAGEPQTKPLPKRLEADSALIFNQRLPLKMLTEATTGQILPRDLRAHIATAIWSRAAILGDPVMAETVESLTGDAHPELRSYMKGFDAASAHDARTFAATWTMLHFPGMRPYISGGVFRDTNFDAIDNFRDNWWCADQFSKQHLPETAELYGNEPPIDPATGRKAEPKPPPYPAFLTAAERTSVDEQWRKLSRLAAGPEYMGTVVLDWAKSHPQDQRLPEALHLAVRATRYGCTSDKTGQISKQAYDLLHARYPNSSWAKQTPYWYK